MSEYKYLTIFPCAVCFTSSVGKVRPEVLFGLRSGNRCGPVFPLKGFIESS